ncbi:hypothetical protein BAE44_0017031 [Dichanthelium oligosanthes]|uniref:Uncharacterized protein n=1 Tax=Dichanthelium oligosanthes TaxID=888268 RepID=A0A1E5V9Y0_9POAL|nr:hypothetical protein BAE44_0017031 [Dichanthelium oligosanthes]
MELEAGPTTPAPPDAEPAAPPRLPPRRPQSPLRRGAFRLAAAPLAAWIWVGSCRRREKGREKRNAWIASGLEEEEEEPLPLASHGAHAGCREVGAILARVLPMAESLLLSVVRGVLGKAADALVKKITAMWGVDDQRRDLELQLLYVQPCWPTPQ